MSWRIGLKIGKVLAKVKNLGRVALGPWGKEYRTIGDIWTGKFPEVSKQVPLSVLEKGFMTFLVFVRSFSLVHIGDFIRKYEKQSFLSEMYVLSWLIVLVLMLLGFDQLGPVWCALVVVYRLIDGLNYRLCIVFVDRYQKGWGLRSLNRSLILLLVNYCEIVVGFAVLYLVTRSVGYSLEGPLTSRIDSLYFSVITITTLGYGDISPISPLGKLLTVTETLMGFIMVVLVIGTFLTGMRNIRNIGAKDVK